MIEIFDCSQNGPEWYAARSGLPTCSDYATLLATPLFLALLMVEVTDLIFAVDSVPAVLTRDELGLDVTVNGPNGSPLTLGFTRIVAPSTVLPQLTPPAQVNALVNAPFSYVLPSSHALTFAATGLPDGLGINAATGEISGTPTTTGMSSVSVTVTNTFGSPGEASFDIRVMDAPVITGTLAASTPIDVPFAYSVTATNESTRSEEHTSELQSH